MLSFCWLRFWTPSILLTGRREENWTKTYTHTILSNADTCFILFWLHHCSWDSRPPEGREALTRRIFWIPLLFFCPLMSLSFSFHFSLKALHIYTISKQKQCLLRKWLMVAFTQLFIFVFVQFLFNCYSFRTVKQPHRVKVSLLLPHPEQETRIPAKQDTNKVKQRDRGGPFMFVKI